MLSQPQKQHATINGACSTTLSLTTKTLELLHCCTCGCAALLQCRMAVRHAWPALAAACSVRHACAAFEATCWSDMPGQSMMLHAAGKTGCSALQCFEVRLYMLWAVRSMLRCTACCCGCNKWWRHRMHCARSLCIGGMSLVGSVQQRCAAGHSAELPVKTSRTRRMPLSGSV